MKENYITITGLNHYYGRTPFAVGRKVRCVKEPHNAYDSDAIRAEMKHIGTVGYVANSPYTTATGTKSASRIYGKVRKKFTARVMFITGHSVICRITDGEKKKKKDLIVPPDVILNVQEEPKQE